jgi:hypothetical protein
MRKILLLCIFLTSCSGLSDAKKVLTNEKIRTTDEFLVKKKEPLEMPPDFKVLPKPYSEKKDIKITESDKIKKIIKKTNQEKVKDNTTGSTEKSILKRIRK